MPSPVLRPLTPEDRSWFEARLSAHPVPGDQLAAYSFPYHMIWRDLFTYEWLELEGHICLVAGHAEGCFLALPPIGPDPCGPAMSQAFALLSERNTTQAMTRIENVPESLAAGCRDRGYRIVPKGPDYLYRRDDLVELRGDRYKSQRAAYNHCVTHARPRLRAFHPADADACLALYRQWREGVQEEAASSLARHMATDAESAHRIGLNHAAELGLKGLVVEVAGRIAAYTLGYPLTSTLAPGGRGQGEGATCCILFEIADRTVKGLGAYIFREFCRDLAPCEFINTMDDSGLDGLRRAKLAAHPLRLVESFIVSPP